MASKVFLSNGTFDIINSISLSIEAGFMANKITIPRDLI